MKQKKLKKLTKEEKKELKLKAKEKGNSLVNDFKKFVLRGNVIDMAVGVIVGASFTSIITTLTNSIFMPLINFIIYNIYGSKDFSEIKTVLRKEVLDDAGNIITSEIAIKWGSFIESILNFFLIAILIFAFVKLFNYIKNKYNYIKEKILKQEKQKEEEKDPTTNELLTEIIDILKEEKENK